MRKILAPATVALLCAGCGEEGYEEFYGSYPSTSPAPSTAAIPKHPIPARYRGAWADPDENAGEDCAIVWRVYENGLQQWAHGVSGAGGEDVKLTPFLEAFTGGWQGETLMIRLRSDSETPPGFPPGDGYGASLALRPGGASLGVTMRGEGGEISSYELRFCGKLGS